MEQYGKYFNYWLVNCKKDRLRPSSYDRLERTHRLYIKDTLGKIPVCKLSTRDIQLVINRMTAKYTRGTVKKVYEALNGCLNYAENVGDIPRNPMKAVVMPRESNCGKPTKRIVIPTADEMSRIIDTAINSTYKSGTPVFHPVYANVVIILANTGLRSGEMLAMTWDKINLSTAMMTVNANVSEVVNRDRNDTRKLKRFITDTKTKNGIRKVPLNSRSIEALMRIKEYYESRGIKSEYVVCGKNGLPASYHDLQRSFQNIAIKAGVNHISLHTLCHYFASACLANGIEMLELSRMLGHGKVSVTMDIYAHLTEKQNERVKQLLEAI